MLSGSVFTYLREYVLSRHSQTLSQRIKYLVKQVAYAVSLIILIYSQKSLKQLAA
jgi:hypothetical protein